MSSAMDRTEAPIRGDTATDPVCGMQVSPADSLTGEFNGRDYYFCGPSCLKAFRADPERYVAASGLSMSGPHPDTARRSHGPAEDQGAIYTCPMDPEVRQHG